MQPSKKSTRVDRFIDWVQNNWLFSALIIVAIIIIAIANFTEAVRKLWAAWPQHATQTRSNTPSSSIQNAMLTPSATTPSPRPGLALTAAQPKGRINALADKYKEGNLFIGVKEALAFQPDHRAERRIRFPIAGIDQPAELVFPILPQEPFALAINFPEYRRAAYLDVSAQFPLAFDYDQLKEDWRLQATVYDIDNDGVPEVLVALHKWNKKYRALFPDDSDSTTLLVYTFHPPANVADLDRSENWTFAGKAEGQLNIRLDEEKIIMQIGSNEGVLYLLKDDHLINAGGVWKDNNGRYKPFD